jgi:hypothetical protein
MRTLVLGMTATLLLAGAALRAQEAMSADDLQQLCQGSDHVSRNACRIYILGITQGVQLGISMAQGKNGMSRPCVPREISAETLEQTVKRRLAKDLTARPGDGTHDAAGFIGGVLAESWPCAKSQPQP